MALQSKGNVTYPLQLLTSENRYRKVYFADRASCKAALKVILKLQGYQSQLDVYGIVGEISNGNGTTHLFRAVHKITGMHVVIKSIKKSHYKNKKKLLRVSEASAMQLC